MSGPIQYTGDNRAPGVDMVAFDTSQVVDAIDGG